MTPEQRDSYKIDRTGWAPGPWDSEPDRVDWEHAGLPCFTLRNHHGNWCGYAGVPPGHPLYGKDMGVPDVDVHGGLTYSHKCAPPVCHVADEIWWFGFRLWPCFRRAAGHGCSTHTTGSSPNIGRARHPTCGLSDPRLRAQRGQRFGRATS